jgi:hypothetical protein
MRTLRLVLIVGNSARLVVVVMREAKQVKLKIVQTGNGAQLKD